MEIEFELSKSVDENAGRYFNAAKKAKKKIEGAKEALKESKKKLEDLQKQDAKFWQEEEKKQAKKLRKKEWYEKFHWFFSSEDFLCIGGKDATTNEIIIKKHMEDTDLVLHTEAPGSPFFLIKNGQEAGEKTIMQTAQAVACYSKSWKEGHASTEVFYVKPDQISKEAQAGEHIAKGSFMIRGKREFYQPKLEFAIGILNEDIVAGPVEAVSAKTKTFIKLVPGRDKKSATAKKIKSKLKSGDLDDIMKFIPSGGSQIKKK